VLVSNAHRCRQRKESTRQGIIVVSLKAFQPVIARTELGKLQKEVGGLERNKPTRRCVATMQSHNRFVDRITKCLTESGFLLDVSIQKGVGIVNGNVASNISGKWYCGCAAGSAFAQRNLPTDSRIKYHVC